MIRLSVPLLPRSLRWIGVLGVAGIIVYFSLITTPPSSTPQPGPFWDKKLHFAAYGVLTLALAYATASLTARTRTRILLVLAGSILFGIGVELTQYILPARFFSPADILANTIGSLLAAAWFLVEPRITYRPVALLPGTDGT